MLDARSAGAAPPEPSEAPLRTPEVVVSATRTAETVGTAPTSITVLTREEIERTPYRQGYEVDDLLRYVPGVQPSNLSSRYNHPTAQAVSLRGLGSRRALVLLDGVPLNDGFGGWINWGMVPDHLARVEVVPGGGSNLYGSWAMGGIIHLLTDPAADRPTLSTLASAGNLDTYTTSLTGRAGTDRVQGIFGYRWSHTNGFITLPADQRGPVDTRNDARHQLLTGALTLTPAPDAQVTLSGQLFREDRSFGTPLSLAARTIGTAAVGVTAARPSGDRWEAKVFGQWQTFRNKTSRITPSPTLRLAEQRERIQTIPSNDFGGSVQWETPLSSRHRVVLGGDARAILGQSEEEIFPAAGPVARSLARGKQVGSGVFAEWLAQPSPQLTVVPSLRADWWKNFDARIESDTGTVTIPRDNVETALNPKLGVRYDPREDLSFGAAVFQAFRAPTLNELYRGFSFGGLTFSPNAALTPERLWGAEASVAFHEHPRSRLLVRATAHYEETRDQIVFVSDSPTVATRRNVGLTRTIGADLELLLTLPRHVVASLGYAYADSTIREFSQDTSREGKRIPNVSRHQVVASLTLGHPDLVQVTVMGRYLSRQFADDRNTQPIADFVVLDASVRTRLSAHAQLFLDAENLTDRSYIATQTGTVKTLGVPLLVTGGILAQY